MAENSGFVGLDSKYIKHEVKGDASEKFSEVNYDFREGIKTSRRQEKKRTSNQGASHERFQLGWYSSPNSNGKSLYEYDKKSNSLVPITQNGETHGTGYKSEQFALRPTRQDVKDDSDSEEEWISEEEKKKNGRVLRKRTRRFESSSTQGNSVKMSHKALGIHY